MKQPARFWITFSLVASLAFAPLSHADSTSYDATEETTINAPVQVAPQQEVVSPQEPYGDLAETEEEDDENPQGTLVTTSANSEEKARKRQFWTNIIIATAAVIVAVVSILVVSNNNGKSP